jgi:hypothetical protein
MTQILDALAIRLKAVVGAILTAAAVYAATAVLHNQPWTLPGLEAAIASGVLVGLGVHQAPNVNRKTNTAHRRVRLLPAPSGCKGGMLPSPRDDRDYQAVPPSTIPATCDFGAGIRWGMLLNDRIGDCYPAALLHALQVLTGYTPVDADALAVYEQVTGYDPTRTDPNGDNPTDNGTAGRPLYAWAKAQGLISSYAAVPTDRTSIRAAIAGHRAVLCEWALPAGAETEGDIWTMPRSNRQAGSWGGHATVEVGYTTTRNRNVTWGEEGTVTGAFEDAYLQAAWVVTTTASAATIARIMASVRAR